MLGIILDDDGEAPESGAGWLDSRKCWIVIQYCHMSHTLTIRLTEELLAWLKEMSKRTGMPVGRIIRQQLESARGEKRTQKFLRHAGLISGPPDLSSRKGFSRR